MPVYCLDTSALVVYVTGEASKADLKKIMSEIRSGKSTGFISMVNLAEFHRVVTRLESAETGDMYVMWLMESNLEIVPLDIEITINASALKQKYAKSKSPFAWGDAFCLATAVEMKADKLITADSDFEKISEIAVLFC